MAFAPGRHTRSACDRCHAKKTKCPRQPGASSCIRCAKAGAHCSFSPAGASAPTRTRPTFKQYEPPGPVNHAGFQPQTPTWDHRWQRQQYQDEGNVDFGDVAPQPFQPWPEHEQLPVDPNLMTPELPMDPNLTPDPPLDPGLQDYPQEDPRLASYMADVTPAQQPEAHQGQQDGCDTPEAEPDVQHLSSLLVSLDAIYRHFPSTQLYHTSKDHLKHWANAMGDQFDLKAHLESVIDYTSQLSNLYLTTIKLAAPGKPAKEVDEECTVPRCVHEDGFSEELVPAPAVDYALLNALVACHTRLLDLVGMLLGHGKICGSVVSKHLPEGEQPFFDIPEIRIGKLVITQDKAAAYFVTFLVDLLRGLCNKIDELEAFNSSPVGRRDQESRVLELQCEILRDRTKAEMHGLVDLSEAMKKKGLMRS